MRVKCRICGKPPDEAVQVGPHLRKYVHSKCVKMIDKLNLPTMTREQFKKLQATRPVELTLTRKDAKALRRFLATDCFVYSADNYSSKQKTRKVILNKLKRAGIK